MSEWISVKERLPKVIGLKDPHLGWYVYRPNAKKEKVGITYVHPSWWTGEKKEYRIAFWCELPPAPLPSPPKD
jgi:hypothetical protein